MPEDYDGDGAADRAIFRSSNQQWWIRPSGGAAEVGAAVDSLSQTWL